MCGLNNESVMSIKSFELRKKQACRDVKFCLSEIREGPRRDCYGPYGKHFTQTLNLCAEVMKSV